MRKPSDSHFVAFSGLLAVLIIFVSLAKSLGWTGRAPDVIYGDEASLPEAILLVLVAIEFYRNKRRALVFAILIAILNGVAVVVGVLSLAWPVALAWIGLWIFVAVVVARLSGRAQPATLKGTN